MNFMKKLSVAAAAVMTVSALAFTVSFDNKDKATVSEIVYAADDTEKAPASEIVYADEAETESPVITDALEAAAEPTDVPDTAEAADTPVVTTAPTTEETVVTTTAEPSPIKEFNVIEAVRIRRDMISGGGVYTLKDYKRLVNFVLGRSSESRRYFNVSYDLGDASIASEDSEKLFETAKYAYKSKVGFPSGNLLLLEGYLQRGWLFDGVEYTTGKYAAMPDHDVVITPTWVRRCKITYNAGDYDDITSNTTTSIMTSEISTYYLLAADRFSRPGYVITGWRNVSDDKVYSPGGVFNVPADDVTFEAVWKPAEYNVSISANNGNLADRTVMTAVFNEEFVLPECEYVYEGKTFAGWKYSGKIYQPGESFIVPALSSGSKLTIVATWK
ncbi:MAG: hypothetical protein NC320_08315 [Clostridium sp.]|nr:hypothetical protein [Clostridium sp.]MCM1547858.1 hypothetical protein [Ruminococcus sp.]